MTEEQSNTSAPGEHAPGFGLAGLGQMALLVFLMLTYPLLGMLWHHQYPVFSIEVLSLLLAFALLARLARDVQLHPGSAYFAHILLPHSPHVYRQDCSLDYESEPWLRYPASDGLVGNSDESRSKRYEKFVPQARCAMRELDALFSVLKENGLYDRATIVVHGDHGSSGFSYSPSVHNMGRLSFRDLRDIFSVLFAVKYPGGSFSANDKITSLNVLMAQTISEITGKSHQELGISVVSEEEPFVYLNDIEPLQLVYVNIFKQDNPKTDSAE